jgi:hypothetical protein
MTQEEKNALFRDVAQRHFDKLLLQSQGIVAAETEKPCDLSVILKFADLGKNGGRYCRYPFHNGSRYNQRTVVLNTQLLDYPQETKSTIAHELAHFATNEIKAHHGITNRRGKWGVHGSVWAGIAKQMGDTGSRCHKLSLMPAYFVVRAIEVPTGVPIWTRKRADAPSIAASPKYADVQVKDTEGFWAAYQMEESA